MSSIIPALTVIVQARFNSQRLPGKVLRQVAGKPMIQFLTERLARCRLAARVIVATSDQDSDDEIAAWCHRAEIECVRGPLDDVAGRFLMVARRYGLDRLVRVSADSPLLDPAIVDRAIALFAEDSWDVVTNTQTRSYPKGQSVEVFRTSLLAGAHLHMTAGEREHVTQHFYRHPDRFRIGNFTREPDLSALQHSVDTPEDFTAFAGLVAAMTRPHWDYGLSEVLALSQEIASRRQS